MRKLFKTWTPFFGTVWSTTGISVCIQILGVSSEEERSVSKRSYRVTREVLYGETEVLSGETLFHRIGPRDCYLVFLIMS